jgi:hypothetical protein
MHVCMYVEIYELKCRVGCRMAGMNTRNIKKMLQRNRSRHHVFPFMDIHAVFSSSYMRFYDHDDDDDDDDAVN